MGFDKLMRNVNAIMANLPESLRLRSMTAPNGAALIPTSNAVLKNFV